ALNDAARTQVDRILQSQGFRSAGVLRHLLNYLTDKCLAGEGETLKEYTIGIDALGKPPSFDPRQESVVRMHMARLRQKLADYYRVEGAEDTIVVDLPKGGFRLTFESRRPVAVPQESTRWTRRESILAAILVVALLGIGLTAAVLRRPEAPASAWTPELKELWEPLLSSNRRLVVCISTPLFVNVPGFGALRDSSLNDWDNASSSKSLSSVEKALGSGMSEPSYDFTDVGTASGAFLLGQFLAPRKENVTIMSASRISWHEIAEDNVVFLGSPEGIHQTEDIPSDVHLVLESNGIRNLHPRAGEPAFFPDAPGRDGEESGLSHALISRLPAMNGHGAILMLSGNQMSAVLGGVQAFTNPVLARMLVSRLKAANGRMPAYFQVVLNVRSMDQVPVEVTYSLHRELSDPGKR
ncbi:MAG TPA: hypothetical protein VEF06_05605, partial [Bryobacteraceae bacterium]|nr:hypothetical protein [Bryobacteraceae bacterium]